MFVVLISLHQIIFPAILTCPKTSGIILLYVAVCNDISFNSTFTISSLFPKIRLRLLKLNPSDDREGQPNALVIALDDFEKKEPIILLPPLKLPNPIICL